MMNNFKAEEAKDNRSRNLRKKNAQPTPKAKAAIREERKSHSVKRINALGRNVNDPSADEVRSELESLMTLSEGCLHRSASQKRDSLTGGYGIKTSKSSSHFHMSSGNRVNLSKTEELAEIVNRQIWVQGI